jgi:hypothetical protein
MDEEITPSDEGKVCLVSPIYRVGDTIVFKYEGNVPLWSPSRLGSSRARHLQAFARSLPVE